MNYQPIDTASQPAVSEEQAVPEVSVVIPISERHDDVSQVYQLYANQLEEMQKTFEFIFVLDGHFPAVLDDLQKLVNNKRNHIKIVKFSARYGESAALMEGFKHANGTKILTLAAYIQIKPEELPKLFAASEDGYDLVITRRFPRRDPLVNRIQSSIYHYLVQKLTKAPFKDISSGMRLINKEIVSEFSLYGDLHRFVPIFATHKGIKVKEVEVSQRKEDFHVRLVKPGIYLRRFLDLITLFFLLKFTKKPLRFFGLIGSSLFIFGVSITGYLAILKILTNIALSNRPLLLLGILLMVFGIQIFSIGLVGELLLFTHVKELDDYKITEIIE
jgi:glycosyltransferase involved in cell wall biosynthesis